MTRKLHQHCRRTRVILAAVAAVDALAGCGSTRTVTVPGPTRTVTATATRTVPGPVRTVYRTRTRTVYVPETPTPAAALPPGVKPGLRPGTYYVDCFTAQCTSLPGAGPFGAPRAASHRPASSSAS